MRFGNFVVVRYKGKIVCGKVGDQGIYLTHMGDASPIPHSEVEPLFEIEVSRPFPEYFKVDDFRKFVSATMEECAQRDEALLRQALEALDVYREYDPEGGGVADKVAAALRERLGVQQ